MRKNSHYVVFGAAGQCDKAVLIGPSKRVSGYECIIVGLKDGEKYKAGDEIEISDIDCIYFTMYFTRLDSLKTFADTINSVVKRWEEESNG